jgi:hypothetical protein
MATNGIWKISERLDNVLKYTTNVEKTKNENYNKEFYCNLHNVIDYVEADYKTEKQYYVSGINCDSKTALEEMIITKNQFNKTNGILGFHAFQSFAEGEVTPELAHKIGIKLANEMWGDRFEVVVSTHLNTNHIHNHFVINSVSFVDGKRYYDNRTTYAEFRKLSNLICEEYGLNTLKEKSCKRSKINYANYQKGNYEKNNYYTRAKEDLDRAIEQAYDYKDFCDLMKLMDYEVMIRYNRISIRRKGYKKNIRIERCFGEDYTIEKLNERIETTHAPRIPFIEVFGNTKYNIDKSNYKKPKYTGIYGLYLHYCYLLKVFPSKYPRQRLSPQVRADIRKMDQISEEVKLLVSNNLKTNEQFFCFQTEKKNKLDELLDQRSKLWYQHKKSKTFEEKESLSKQIDELNKEINPLRKEVVLCDDILKRSKVIEQNLSELDDEKSKGKEVSKDEFIR